VIKIEPPGGSAPPAQGFGTGYFAYYNRNIFALDYKSPDGLAVTRELIATADVLIENMAPHALIRRVGA
jgi:crotonobetainyl-CoA:carnitine CoA-transferase CaiB-like acyl-CoA transferase